MKRIIGFLLGFLATLFIGWVSGIDLNHRSVEVAGLLMMSIVFGVLGLVCPYLDD